MEGPIKTVICKTQFINAWQINTAYIYVTGS